VAFLGAAGASVLALSLALLLSLAVLVELPVSEATVALLALPQDVLLEELPPVPLDLNLGQFG
jgi:hypothetical protein